MTPDLQIVFKSPKDLIPYERNAKIHSPEQIANIAGQIKAFGFDQPIVLNKSGVIIKGHGRRLAALQLGLEVVPTITRESLDDLQSVAARIGDNKVSEAPWDPELLKLDLSLLSTQKFDVQLTGIDPKQIQSILSPPTSQTMFGEDAHKDVSERKDQYEASDVRQIILVTDPATFDQLMGQFAELQEEFGVETNLEVVQKLVLLHAQNRTFES